MKILQISDSISVYADTFAYVENEDETSKKSRLSNQAICLKKAGMKSCNFI